MAPTDPTLADDIDSENSGEHDSPMHADVPMAVPKNRRLQTEPRQMANDVPEGDRVSVDPTLADEEIVPDSPEEQDDSAFGEREDEDDEDDVGEDDIDDSSCREVL